MAPWRCECGASMPRVNGLPVARILTLPLLAARLAGGFIAPATQEILYPAIRQALEAGGYEDIDKVSELPGMPVAVLSALRDWWDMEVPASFPTTLVSETSRCSSAVSAVRCLLECCRLPIWSRPPWSDFALPQTSRRHHLQDVPEIRPFGSTLRRFAMSCRSDGSDPSHSSAPGSPAKSQYVLRIASLHSADLCADPRNEVREALRWARALVTDGKASPPRSPFRPLHQRPGTTHFWFFRARQGCPYISRMCSSAGNSRRAGLCRPRGHPVTWPIAGAREALFGPAAA